MNAFSVLVPMSTEFHSWAVGERKVKGMEVNIPCHGFLDCVRKLLDLRERMWKVGKIA